jgi:hypothetical protein
MRDVGTTQPFCQGYDGQNSTAYFASKSSSGRVSHFNSTIAAFLTGTTMTPSSGSPKPK